MFLEYLNSICGFAVYERLIIFDFQEIISEDLALSIKDRFEYELIYYDDIEKFRYLYESKIKENQGKYLIILRNDMYLPYDIRENFNCQEIGYNILFPKLNSYVLKNAHIFDMNLLYISYDSLYIQLGSEVETRKFLSEEIYTTENVKEYSRYLIDEIRKLLENDSHKTWREVALLYAKLEYLRYRSKYDFYDKDLANEIQEKFKHFILNNFSKLSSLSDFDGPVLLNKAMSYIFRNSDRKSV